MRKAKIINLPEDGGTFNHDFQLVVKKSGYWVALTDNCMKQSLFVEVKKLRNIANALKMTDYYFGYWKDGEKQFLDISIHVKSKKLALKIAEMHNQAAIFDCKNVCCIYLEKVSKAA